MHGQTLFHPAPTVLSRQRASDPGSTNLSRDLCPGGSPGFRIGQIFRLLESSLSRSREAEGHFGTGEKGIWEAGQFSTGAVFRCYGKE